MKEKVIEQLFVWAVESLGGKTWKFASPGRPGVADRIACMPDGSTWFVEIKKPDGRLSALQVKFGDDMVRLKQKYAVLWSKEDVMEWKRAF
ncbi:MAG: VRR-NUC domain-containing protein [Saprospiraceae bacterium]